MMNRLYTISITLILILGFSNISSAQFGTIQGYVSVDYTPNCVFDSADVSWKNVIVEAENNLTNEKFYAVSDTIGYYSIPADSGNYTVRIQDFYNLVPCQPIQTANLNFAGAYDTIDFSLDPTYSCPVMNVGISAPLLRACDTAIYTVNYSNDGPTIANNAYVDIEIDSFLTIDTLLTTLAIDSILGFNRYRFNLGNVSPNDFLNFNVGTTVQCGVTVGRTHCVKAQIYPNNPCNTNTFVPKVEASGQCIGGQIEFYLKNASNTPMFSARNAWIIEDDLIIQGQPYTLDSNGIDTITIPNPVPGAMYRIEAQPDSLTPKILGNQKVWAFIEGGCNSSSGINTGFATDYYTDNNSPYIAHSCQQNVANMGTAEKIGYPEGYSTPNYIECNTPIKYRVHFQNTTNSTISAVTIKDTLSEHLDIKTLEISSSSHEIYQWRLFRDRTLEIKIFANLPSSSINEDASHGFLEYTIYQNKNLPDGTVINNTAYVDLDYTGNYTASNTTLHTIGKNFIVSTVENTFVENVEVKSYPNPFQDKATIEVLGVDYPELKLSLYNMAGQLIQQQQSANGQFEVYRNRLPQGVYIYKITNNDQLINVGKIIIQ
ncbi:MAG: T9SS type A sorting domain-containing protein [Aureispira sp.]|nr:T9SS type A sorting domain-containing protein [Aureispira sp.]